jgi:hypothetical protein
MYRTGRESAFWLGIVVFGGGYLLLSRVLSTDATGNPVAFTDRALDTPALDLRSAPAASKPMSHPACLTRAKGTCTAGANTQG